MSVTVIFGPMFSGKSTEMFRQINRHIIAGKKTAVFKYSNDTRYGRKHLAYSHDGLTLKAIPVSSFENITIRDDIQVIGIDEGQFIEGLVDFCDYHANHGRSVIVSGLDADFKRDPFQQIVDLIPKAEHVVKLHSVCVNCKDDQGAFSKKISSNKDIEDIGGIDKYISVCRKCYFKDISDDRIEEHREILKHSI